MSDSPPVLCLVRDLLFASKIAAAAAAAGVTARVVRDPAQLDAAVAADGRLLLVDLNQPGAIDAAAAWQARTGRAAVGFVAHVDAATAAAARAAGLSRVLARSAFVAQLPGLLRPEPTPER